MVPRIGRLLLTVLGVAALACAARAEPTGSPRISVTGENYRYSYVAPDAPLQARDQLVVYDLLGQGIGEHGDAAIAGSRFATDVQTSQLMQSPVGVPEPSTWLILATGLPVLLGLRRVFSRGAKLPLAEDGKITSLVVLIKKCV
jgi:hypothetical protein